MNEQKKCDRVTIGLDLGERRHRFVCWTAEAIE